MFVRKQSIYISKSVNVPIEVLIIFRKSLRENKRTFQERLDKFCKVEFAGYFYQGVLVVHRTLFYMRKEMKISRFHVYFLLSFLMPSFFLYHILNTLRRHIFWAKSLYNINLLANLDSLHLQVIWKLYFCLILQNFPSTYKFDEKRIFSVIVDSDL